MLIDKEKCIKCKICVPYCPVDCIKEMKESMEVDLEECVECGICMRNANCPTQAIYQPYLEMPRAIRKAFSDPFGKHENTEMKHMGRGTEEIKTNDVTGIIHDLEHIALAVELGRPSIGARLYDLEKVSKAVAKFDVQFEKHNPITSLIVDKSTGKIDPEVLNEKILSGIVEFKININKLDLILKELKRVEKQVDTVFSVSVICKVNKENKTLIDKILQEYGYDASRVPSKTNMGLGKPKYEERIKEVN